MRALILAGRRMIDQKMQAELVSVAHAMADVARDVTLQYFRTTSLDTQNKASGGDFDPVTVADKACERALREVLADLRPDDGILGEEEAPVAGTSGLTWVIDPIDGTRTFMSGFPSWGVLIAVNAGGAPILGIIDQPFTQERFLGGFGQTSYQHQQNPVTELQVRSCAALKDAVMFSTFPEIGTTAERTAFEAVRDQVRLTRYGADCYGYALVALGQIDLVIEAGLSPYDLQGPIAVVEAAGGVVTNWQGGPAHDGGQVIAAGDARIHAQAMTLLNS